MRDWQRNGAIYTAHAAPCCAVNRNIGGHRIAPHRSSNISILLEHHVRTLVLATSQRLIEGLQREEMHSNMRP